MYNSKLFSKQNLFNTLYATLSQPYTLSHALACYAATTRIDYQATHPTHSLKHSPAPHEPSLWNWCFSSRSDTFELLIL